MVDANRGLDVEGNIVDYHSIIEVRRGDEVETCKTTVNDPCHAFGYKVHQAAWFNDVARLRIEAPNGQLLYDDVVDFDSQTAVVPFVRVTTAAGDLLFEQQLPQMATDPGLSPGREDDSALAVLVFPESPGAAARVTYAAAWSFRDGQMHLTLSGADLSLISLTPGDLASTGAYRIEFIEAQAIPALTIGDMPGAIGDEVTVQMPTGGDGVPYLLVSGVSYDPLVLRQDTPVENAEGYAYTFRGQLEAWRSPSTSRAAASGSRSPRRGPTWQASPSAPRASPANFASSATSLARAMPHSPPTSSAARTDRAQVMASNASSAANDRWTAKPGSTASRSRSICHA